MKSATGGANKAGAGTSGGAGTKPPATKAPVTMSGGKQRRDRDDADEERREVDIPFSHKKEKSMYDGMDLAEKKKMYLKRIEEDKVRAVQQLALLKKAEIKKKVFVLKKNVYDLKTNHAVCVARIPDRDAYYFGMSNGSTLFFDCKTEKIITAAKGDTSPILDVAALTEDRLVTVDDFSKVKIYQEYKLIKVVAGMCALGLNPLSRVFATDESHVYFVNAERDGVTKFSGVDYSCELIKFSRANLTQVAMSGNKLFALSEEGYLHCCTFSPATNPDEEEAMPGGMEFSEVKIENLTNEQIGIGLKKHSEDLLESSQILDTSDHNPSGANDHHDESDPDAPKTVSQLSYERMERVLNQPVMNKFFRTLAVSTDYVALVAHDGQGHNVLYVYDHKLTLKAFKYLKIEELDYSFDVKKYLNKLEIVQKKEGTFIYASTPKEGSRMYIYKLSGDEITLFRRFKQPHKGLVTDLRAEVDNLCTAGRDNKVNFYTLDYRYNIK
jgi:hypothetical protein